jgi:putative ABC transport system permease protein
MTRRSRWRHLRFLRPDPAADVDDEIRFHMEMRVRDYLAGGMSESQARRAAAERFGDVGSVATACVTIDERIARRTRWSESLHSLGAEVRIAGRMLRRAPAYASVAIATLALGIGGVTAIFSVLQSVVLRPLPYPDAGQLVRLQEGKRGGAPWNGVSVPDFLDWQSRSRTIAHAGIAQVQVGMNLTGGDEPEHLAAATFSDGLFALIGVPPLAGRWLDADDYQPGAAPAAVLSYSLWQRRYRGDRAIVGKTIGINGRSVIVRGVMPREFRFPDAHTELWLPFPVRPGVGYATPNGRWARIAQAYARLAPGATVDAAQRELAGIAAQLERENPGPSTDIVAWVTPLKESMIGGTAHTLWIMLGAAGFVLLIACANVASLGLVRSLARSREIAVRLAHGATRRHLARQFIAEGLVLAFAAAAVGAGLAFLAVRLLGSAGPSTLPRLAEVQVNGVALAASAGTALVVAIALGLGSLAIVARQRASLALRGGTRESEGRHPRRARAALVVAEVALAVTVLAGAGLLATSYVKLVNVRPGFSTAHAVAMTLTPRGAAYRGSPTALPELFDRVLATVRALPGVEAASLVDGAPLTGGGVGWTFVPEGATLQQGQEPTATVHAASDDYFRTLGIPLLAGHAFDRSDVTHAADVAVVNQALATAAFPNANPIGQRIALGSVGSANRPMTIVGVAGDVHNDGLAAAPSPEIFRPYSPESLGNDLTLIVRAGAEPAAIVSLVRGALKPIDRDLPIAEVRTLDAILGESVARERFTVMLIAVFATLAVAMAAIGISGILAQSVAQERKSIAIRMALGARGGEIVRDVFRRGIVLTLGGVALGVVASLGVTRLLATLLFGVTPTDPLVLGGVVVVFVAIATVACIAPAVRAVRVAPATVLRTD